jgi:hypothetical protein
LELATSAAPGFTPANTVIIDHNTILHEGPGNSYLVLGDSTPVAENFVFTNNLTTNGQYGLSGSPSQYLINYLIENNASLANNNVNAAGFVDYAGGDYRLADTSPYKNAGNDGRDLGADVTAVFAATATAVSGN